MAGHLLARDEHRYLILYGRVEDQQAQSLLHRHSTGTYTPAMQHRYPAQKNTQTWDFHCSK
eukprot:c10777_g1_i1 orf=1-180(-)